MREVATVVFTDVETSDEGIAIVRESPRGVALALSLASDGDVEVFLSRDDAKKVIAALQEAISTTPRG